LSRRLVFSLVLLILLAALGVAAWWTLLRPAKPPATPLGWPAHHSTLLGRGSSHPTPLDDPFGLALDAQGNLYLSDGGDANRIRKLAADGTFSVLAGGKEGFADGQGTAASFNTPSGLALDAQGNLYVADTGNHAIRKITPTGQVSTLAGNGQPGWRDGPAAQAQFNGPVGVAVDGAGQVYVTDSYNNRIRVIEPNGVVRTLAGGERPGFQDGAAGDARFDTPCAVLVLPNGDLLIADTANHALRKLTIATGTVSTLLRGDPDDRDAPLRRPMGLALARDGVVYVTDGARGQVVQLAPDGRAVALPEANSATQAAAPSAGPPASASSAPSAAQPRALRLFRPAGIALAADGSLRVADQASHQVLHLSAQPLPPIAPAPVSLSARPATSAPFPWPVKPQLGWHEVVGVVGEVRGNFDGESRDHLHAGLDVQADVGDTVLAVAPGKVALALPNWGFGELSEGLNIADKAYIHMRVGRTPQNKLLDGTRFALLMGDDGKPERVRVRRGTRFRPGDALGTVNRMAHVHLEHNPNGWVENPLVLPFAEQQDTVPPRILGIALYDGAGQKLADKTAKGRLRVPRGAGPLNIVVEAVDQMNGNLPRRRLGLYQLGYQLLRTDGTPLPGFEQPLVNLQFNQLPHERDAVKIAYWADSGITVHGAATTRFLYVVSNRLRDGQAQVQGWDPAGLTPGDYRLRIFATDFAGNQALVGRDLALTLE
jgi:DNA-binding beta-propeller fold protein YncE